MYTTLNKIRNKKPCEEGWPTLLRNLNKTGADDEPLSIVSIIDSNGIEDAIWGLRAVEGHDKEIRLFAVRCARQVQHLMTDPNSIAALDVAERFVNGKASIAELEAAEVIADVATYGAAIKAARAVRPTCIALNTWGAALMAAAAADVKADARVAQEKILREICKSINQVQ